MDDADLLKDGAKRQQNAKQDNAAHFSPTRWNRTSRNTAIVTPSQGQDDNHAEQETQSREGKWTQRFHPVRLGNKGRTPDQRDGEEQQIGL